GYVKIVELATGSTVTSWDVPTAISNLYVSWSPDGKRLCAGGGGLLGLWEFNIETGEAKKLLGGIIHSATWSSDGHLAIASYAPHEIWIAQAERIGEGQRLEEHYREVIRWATRRSEACTKTARYYFTRARIYRTMGDNEKALASLEELINLYTGRIETKPEVTSNYIYRAKVYQFLGDTEKASADLKQSLGSPFTPSGRLTPIDVQSRANQKLTETLGNNPDDDLRELPRGEQVFGGVKFNIDDALIQLHSQRLAEPRPRKVEGIMINQSFSRLYILHSTGWSVADGTVIGQYKVNYEDKTGETIPIVYGEDVRNWTVISSNINAEFKAPVTRGKLVWIGENPVSRSVGGLRRLYLTLWKNPHPDKKVSSIDFISMMTDAAPFCVAMTVEETAAP
ncbi:MAG: tetratricopeptide repeat protein, partial [Planctomycetes bacterium]|nr:tetratricopeptide repeat protein [Planctomycetota bacterium]